MSGEAPIIILTLLVGWLGFFVLGYGVILLPVTHSWDLAFRESASSTFTLGFTLRSQSRPAAVDFLAAATGMISIALQIGYMPTLYGAYNRRETEVTLLHIRAGNPPWGPELISRATRLSTIETLPSLYENWERWASDVVESHSSYPVLLRFRSPHQDASWIVALLAVLDSAAIMLSIAPSQANLQFRLCLRAGFLCVQRLAETVGIVTNKDPSPDTEIELPFDEFAQAYHRIQDGGFEMERDVQEAWAHFKGWRVNYEAPVYALAKAIDAVPVVWSGPRRFSDPQVSPDVIVNRTPANPRGDGPREIPGNPHSK